MAADELTRTLMLEEVAAPRAIAEALFASVSGGAPLLQALVDSGAATPDVLARYLARNEAPFLKHVVPLPELVDLLPPGLCVRLMALPVRRDPVTGTVDVVVPDIADPHPANEVAFHLGVPVRAVRAPLVAIEEALRKLRMGVRDSLHSTSAFDRFNEAATRAHTDDERMYDSRPRGEPSGWAESRFKGATLPPVAPALAESIPSRTAPRRGGLVIDTDSAPPPPEPPPPQRMKTPAWGTPIHILQDRVEPKPGTEPPQSGYGSEIPIPLTRKTFGVAALRRGATQRPPPSVVPPRSALGEGYVFDTTNLRDVVEKTSSPRIESAPLPSFETGISLPPHAQPLGSFIPGPPPLPGMFAPHTPQLPFPEMGGILAALRNAGSRDEVLELVLTGARMVALKVALFVVKKGGYLGWLGTAEFADRTALQSVLIPLEADSIFDRAVREGIYLGPIRYDEVHAPLLRVVRNPSRDVAAVPIRVSGKTAVVIVADELGDTMIGTRRLEELARQAGDAFARIVRTRASLR